MILYNYIEMARVTGVPIDYLTTKGQQIKVLSQLFRKAKQEDLFIPFYEKAKGAEEEDYEGAVVMDPKRGFHTIPVATLDFSSLYPSIMIAHNLCYTTVLKIEQLEKLDPSQYEKTPQGDYFIRSEVYKGILPRILDELLTARAKAKDDLKKEKDPFKKAVFDGRQLALKVSANSVYGFTGATVGRLPCLQISSAVTAYGRGLIHQAKDITLEVYKERNVDVIYGDTVKGLLLKYSHFFSGFYHGEAGLFRRGSDEMGQRSCSSSD